MAPREPAPADKLLYPGEVALLLHVHVVTVTRWANAGRLTYIRTPGGQRRYHAAQFEHVRAYIEEGKARYGTR